MFRLITKAGMLTVLAIAANIAPVFAQNFALGTPPFENPQPAVVVDSGGRAVGPYFPVPSPVNATTPQDYALVKVPSAPGSTSNLFFFLPVLQGGFGSLVIGLIYTTKDCSGTAFLGPLRSGTLAVPIYSSYGVGGGVLYYPKPGPGEKLEVVSARNVLANGSLTPCQVFAPSLETVSPAQSFKLSTLGFVPRFHISE